MSSNSTSRSGVGSVPRRRRTISSERALRTAGSRPCPPGTSTNENASAPSGATRGHPVGHLTGTRDRERGVLARVNDAKCTRRDACVDLRDRADVADAGHLDAEIGPAVPPGAEACVAHLAEVRVDDACDRRDRDPLVERGGEHRRPAAARGARHPEPRSVDVVSGRKQIQRCEASRTMSPIDVKPARSGASCPCWCPPDPPLALSEGVIDKDGHSVAGEVGIELLLDDLDLRVSIQWPGGALRPDEVRAQRADTGAPERGALGSARTPASRSRSRHDRSCRRTAARLPAAACRCRARRAVDRESRRPSVAVAGVPGPPRATE